MTSRQFNKLKQLIVISAESALPNEQQYIPFSGARDLVYRLHKNSDPQPSTVQNSSKTAEQLSMTFADIKGDCLSTRLFGRAVRLLHAGVKHIGHTRQARTIITHTIHKTMSPHLASNSQGRLSFSLQCPFIFSLFCMLSSKTAQDITSMTDFKSINNK